MGTISENITRINQAKVDIKNAIIAKGGTVTDSDKINVYAQAIEALSSGDETVKGIIDRSITTCNIPEGTTIIGEYAFTYCDKLTSVTIPDSVTRIDGYVFLGCKKLTTITVKAITPPTLSSYKPIPDNVTAIYVPSGSVNAYKSASNWSSHASKIQAIPE